MRTVTKVLIRGEAGKDAYFLQVFATIEMRDEILKAEATKDA